MKADPASTNRKYQKIIYLAAVFCSHDFLEPSALTPACCNICCCFCMWPAAGVAIRFIIHPKLLPFIIGSLVCRLLILPSACKLNDVCPLLGLFSTFVMWARVVFGKTIPCVCNASSLTTSRDVLLVVVGFEEGGFEFSPGSDSEVSAVLDVPGWVLVLKLCLWACNLVRQVHHAGWLSWAFSNAPWPREIIGMSGCIVEMSFSFEMK